MIASTEKRRGCRVSPRIIHRVPHPAREQVPRSPFFHRRAKNVEKPVFWPQNHTNPLKFPPLEDLYAPFRGVFRTRFSTSEESLASFVHRVIHRRRALASPSGTGAFSVFSVGLCYTPHLSILSGAFLARSVRAAPTP